MKRARCKFRCSGILVGEGASRQVQLQAAYDPKNIPEDEAFTKYTPWGEMKFGLENPALEGFFQPGKTYYIDITPVEE